MAEVEAAYVDVHARAVRLRLRRPGLLRRGEQRQQLCRGERGEGAGGVAGPAPRHQVVRACLPGGGHLHGVFEVAVGQSQRLLEHVAVNRGHLEHGQQLEGVHARRGGRAVLGQEVEQRRDAVRGDEAGEPAGLGGGQYRGGVVVERLPPLEDIEDHVDVEQRPVDVRHA